MIKDLSYCSVRTVLSSFGKLEISFGLTFQMWALQDKPLVFMWHMYNAFFVWVSWKFPLQVTHVQHVLRRLSLLMLTELSFVFCIWSAPADDSCPVVNPQRKTCLICTGMSTRARTRLLTSLTRQLWEFRSRWMMFMECRYVWMTDRRGQKGRENRK